MQRRRRLEAALVEVLPGIVFVGRRAKRFKVSGATGAGQAGFAREAGPEPARGVRAPHNASINMSKASSANEPALRVPLPGHDTREHTAPLTSRAISRLTRYDFHTRTYAIVPRK